MKEKTNFNHLTLAELQEELMKLRKQQFSLRMRRATGDLTTTHHFKIVRRAIARVKTAVTQKSGEVNG